MFRSGDAIVHPTRGAGVIVSIDQRQWRGGVSQYYRIRLLDQPGTSLMIPISEAETLGLRYAIEESDISQVWHVLASEPQVLPTDHKERYQVLEGKLYAGDVYQVAEVVRDMAWRQREEGTLTTVGKRHYDESVKMLAGEIAAAQGIELSEAQAQIIARLHASQT